MTIPAAIDPSDICERVLREEKAYNIEHRIWPSLNAVADRLLERRIELTDAYGELCEKLGGYPHALKEFLHLLLAAAVFYNPDNNARARACRERLDVVNAKIAGKADELALLLDERDELNNGSGFSSDTHYHPLSLIEDAAATNYLYQSYIRKTLEGLRGRFDQKYWPSISDCLKVLSVDAEDSKAQPNNPLTEAATTGVRNSRADFFKALFVSIEENSQNNGGFLPRNFRLTDASYAALANCALDLGPDEMVDSVYVKRLRQRERNSWPL